MRGAATPSLMFFKTCLFLLSLAPDNNVTSTSGFSAAANSTLCELYYKRKKFGVKRHRWNDIFVHFSAVSPWPGHFINTDVVMTRGMGRRQLSVSGIAHWRGLN